MSTVFAASEGFVTNENRLFSTSWTKNCYLPLSAAKYIFLSQFSEFVMTRWVAREDVPEYSYILILEYLMFASLE